LILDPADKLLNAPLFLELKPPVIGDERESGSLENANCRILNTAGGKNGDREMRKWIGVRGKWGSRGQSPWDMGHSVMERAEVWNAEVGLAVVPNEMGYAATEGKLGNGKTGRRVINPQSLQSVSP